MNDRLRRRAAGLVLLLAVVAACGQAPAPSPTPATLPTPTCGGLKIAIEGALSCERLARIALEVLASEAPEHLARGVVAIDVVLQSCPVGEVPPQIDCTGVSFVQLVTLTFGPAPAGGPIEPSLTVAIEPVSGRLLGIVNPLIR